MSHKIHPIVHDNYHTLDLIECDNDCYELRMFTQGSGSHEAYIDKVVIYDNEELLNLKGAIDVILKETNEKTV